MPYQVEISRLKQDPRSEKVAGPSQSPQPDNVLRTLLRPREFRQLLSGEVRPNLDYIHVLFGDIFIAFYAWVEQIMSDDKVDKASKSVLNDLISDQNNLARLNGLITLFCWMINSYSSAPSSLPFYPGGLERIHLLKNLLIQPQILDELPDIVFPHIFSSADWNPSTVWAIHWLFMRLMDGASWTWSEEQLGVPFSFSLLDFCYHQERSGVELLVDPEELYQLIPEQLVFGGLSFEKRFGGRLLVPTAMRGVPEYVRNLFDSLAKLYPDISDLELKEAVFEGIFEILHQLSSDEAQGKVNICDAGCGPGLIWQLLKEGTLQKFEITGVDFSPNMCALAQDVKRYKKVYCRDLRNLDLPADEVWDYAFLSFVDIWLDDTAGVLAELRTRTKKAIVFNVHKPEEGWKERLTKELIEKYHFSSVDFKQNEVTLANGQTYVAYYAIVYC